MATLTVFNHGTGFNHVKGTTSNELVASLHNGMNGVPATIANGAVTFGTYMINEGPGSGQGGVALPSAVNPMTGRLLSDETTKYGKSPGGGARSSFAKGFAGQIKGSTSTAKGALTGAGWTANVQRTMQIITGLKFDHGHDVNLVNLVGWSRGAVTCIRIANALQDLYEGAVQCNIFAIDPVAGRDAGIDMPDTRNLPVCVRNFVAVLATHERRRSFAPQDMSRINVVSHAATTTTFLPMPGKHNEQVIGRSSVATHPEARVTRSLAYAFLTHFDTRFSAPPVGALSSDAEMCSAYAEMVLALSTGGYADSSGFGARVVGMGLGRRDFAKSANMGKYVAGGKGSYWVNEHHRACFQFAFGPLHNMLFTSSVRDGQIVPFDAGMLGAGGGLGGVVARSLAAKGHLVEMDGTYHAVLGSGANQSLPGYRNRWPAGLPRHA